MGVLTLHNYQQRAADFVRRHTRCILSIDMGLGKTAATLAAVDALQPESLIIVAPKRVAESVWRQEAEKWGYDDIYNKMVVVAGTRAQRLQAWLDADKPYKVVSRENLGDIFTYDDRKGLSLSMRFEMAIFDELTSFKAVSSKRTKYAIMIGRAARRAVGLTGTFLANGAVDVFGQAAAVGLLRCERQTDFYIWRSRYFIDKMAGSGQAFHKWQLVTTLDEVLKPLRDDIFTLAADDYLEIPPVTTVRHAVTLSDDEQQRYDNLEAFLGCNIAGVDVSVDERAKFAKLQTMADGFIYAGDKECAVATLEEWRIIRGERSTKLDEVVAFCDSAADEGENVLLFYAFKGEREWLREMMTGKDYEVADVRDGDALQRWLRGEYRGVLMAHPASAGHGLNMQAGGRILVWSTLTYNYELFAQANARLARQGQTKRVHIHIFTAKNTCEDRKLSALLKKDKEQNEFKDMTKIVGL